MAKKNPENVRDLAKARIRIAKKAILELKARKPSLNWRADVRRFMAIIEDSERVLSAA